MKPKSKRTRAIDGGEASAAPSKKKQRHQAASGEISAASDIPNGHEKHATAPGTSSSDSAAGTSEAPASKTSRAPAAASSKAAGSSASAPNVTIPSSRLEQKDSAVTGEKLTAASLSRTDDNLKSRGRKKVGMVKSEPYRKLRQVNRARKPQLVQEGPVRHSSHQIEPGVVLAVGTGDTGQLGLGPDVMDKVRPALVSLPLKAVQICAGGMHSACALQNGQVFTWGCNDDGALGRETPEEDDCFEPGLVKLPEKIVQISAGDSHTAALSTTGGVYIWGTFRDGNGVIGLTDTNPGTTQPIRILQQQVVVKIASGADHLLALTVGGHVFSMGNCQQGQLGRVAQCFSDRGGRKGLFMLLSPQQVHCQNRRIIFTDVWTGTYTSFARSEDDKIWAWGLNNYSQLGFDDTKNIFTPCEVKSFHGKKWKEISGGEHHTVALDAEGRVHALGRREYGRLGLGPECEDQSAPTPVPALSDKQCVHVDARSSVSFAVTETGMMYAWGMGSNQQLSQGDEEDAWEPVEMTGKQINNKKGLQVSSGGQHTTLMVTE